MNHYLGFHKNGRLFGSPVSDLALVITFLFRITLILPVLIFGTQIKNQPLLGIVDSFAFWAIVSLIYYLIVSNNSVDSISKIRREEFFVAFRFKKEYNFWFSPMSGMARAVFLLWGLLFVLCIKFFHASFISGNLEEIFRASVFIGLNVYWYVWFASEHVN